MENLMVYIVLIGALVAMTKLFRLSLKDEHNSEMARVRYTEEAIKDIFVEYWKDRMAELESPQEQGQLLYRASKTDGVLDQLFHPKPPELTEEQLEAQQVARSKNVVPLHPQK